MTAKVLESEMCLLGAAIKNQEWVTAILEKMRMEHFFSAKNALIFDAIKTLCEQNKKVCLEGVIALVKSQNVSADYVLDVWTLGNEFALPEPLIEEIKDGFQKRRLAQAAEKLLLDCESRLSSNQVLKIHEDTIYGIGQESARKTVYSINDLLTKPEPLSVTIAQRRANYEAGIPNYQGFPTGFKDLDDYIQGFTPGHVTLIAARTGIGKTSFLMNLINKMIMQNRMSVMFFNLEMPAQQLRDKLLCCATEVDFGNYLKGNLVPSEIERLNQAISVLEKKPLIIDDQPALNINQIQSRATRWKRTHQIDILFIDYVQLIQSSKRYDNRYLEVGEISMRLKAMSKELSIPIVCAAQINREADKREGKRPQISDLRESGQLEQDADEIILLGPPESRTGESPERLTALVQLYVAKNRFGPTGSFRMFYNRKTGVFGDWLE